MAKNTLLLAGKSFPVETDLSFSAFLTSDGRPSLAELVHPLAFLHDYVLGCVLWMTSPRFRSHQQYVLAQNDHLDNHREDLAGCPFCQERFRS